LFWQDTFYLNGETLAVPSTLKTCMKMLADTRQLDCTQLEEALLANLADMLYPHYLAGYLALGD
ncbi:MAG: hypothetical protein B7X98_01770, partial [Methylophilaceae bacterium 17-43-7]